MTIITETQLTAMRVALDALEAKPKTRFTSPEVVEAVARQIRHARDTLGYDLIDIALLLQRHGLSIKPSTLRGYLRKVAEVAPKPMTRKPRSSAVRKTHAGAALQASNAAHDDDLELADGHGG